MKKRPIRICVGCDEPGPIQAHGLCTPCYNRQPRELARRRWRMMIRRCTDPRSADWKHYGARGIRVCDRWMQSFDAYYTDVGDRPAGMSLDRVDNDGDYEPSNVRWATPGQQVANRRVAFGQRDVCKWGHSLSEATVYVSPLGHHVCRECRRDQDRARRGQKMGAAS